MGTGQPPPTPRTAPPSKLYDRNGAAAQRRTYSAANDLVNPAADKFLDTTGRSAATVPAPAATASSECGGISRPSREPIRVTAGFQTVTPSSGHRFERNSR